MRLAIVLNTSWNIVNFRKGLIHSFLEDGHEVICIAPKDEFSEEISSWGCEYIPLKIKSRSTNPFRDLLLIVKLFKIYRKVQPTVILHYTNKPNIYGSFASYILNIPTINNVCGLGSGLIGDGLLSRFIQKLYRLSIRLSNKVLFQNTVDRDLFITKKIADPKKSDLVPGSGIDISKFFPSESKNTNREFTFLLISRVIKDKGIKEYVDAAKIMKDNGHQVKFQLLGELDHDPKYGFSKDEIEAWIDLELIEYLGYSKDVRPFIQACDCVVLPSYREGAPRSLLEAGAMGKPMVATNVAGCNQIVVPNYNGFLCLPKDARDLADKMTQILNLDKLKLIEMGINSRTYIKENYDEKIVIKKYHDTIGLVLTA